MSKVKIKSICVDTLTALQINQYMGMINKPNHDQWFDFGKDIYTFIVNLQKLGFTNILIIGEPGTGKSSGMRTLEKDTNIWFNTDAKNPVWKGGKEEYGTKKNPRQGFHFIPKEYDEIIKTLKSLGRDAFIDEPICFLTGHIDTFKQGPETRVRLKTIGQVATKMQLEGKLETVLYSKVDMKDGSPNFVLDTQNNGYNTARSPQEMLPGIIPNDYKMILEAVLSY
jgi:hypothetical protein